MLIRTIEDLSDMLVRYNYTANLSRGNWAWEFARRNPALRDDAYAVLPQLETGTACHDIRLLKLRERDLAAESWGLLYFPDPGQTALSTDVFWSDQTFPRKIAVHVRERDPDEIDEIFEKGTRLCKIVHLTDAAGREHFLVKGANCSVQIRCSGKSLLCGEPVKMEFSVSGFDCPDEYIETLKRAHRVYDPEATSPTGHNPTADGLAALPKSYGEIAPEDDVLGPPLPGDLGTPILKAQREGRMGLPEQDAPAPDPMREQLTALEAELRAREAALSDAARGSGVFFQVGASAGSKTIGVSGAAAAAPSSLRFPDLSAFAPSDGSAFGSSLSEDPNRQVRKLDFLGTETDPSIYNPHRLESPVSPYQLMAGTIIPATLLTGVNSDLPGQVIAQVTSPVYDTVTGETVLVPQGAKLIGRYDSVIAFGQSRALLVWSRIIMPDGTSIRIDNLAGVDARGYAGLEDKVDYHSWKLLQGVALSTLLGVGSELASDDEGDIARALRRSAQTGANEAGQEIVRRNLDVQPSITIRPGWRLGVLVNKDIVLKPYEGGD